ncbi:MAG: histidine kinase [Gammaproteobacteria bacterium]|jgi:two-component system nitrate/nitrite sensor histidine kinase NarX
MPRSVTDISLIPEARRPALRKRLLTRLSALLAVLILLGVLGLTEAAATLTPEIRLALLLLLMLGGLALTASLMTLVQRNLLDPLDHISSWARNLCEHSYTEPLPASLYAACTQLAHDLEHLGNSLGSTAKPRTTATSPIGLEADSLQILYEVVSSINTAHGLDDLLTRFLFTLKRITQARAALIWVVHSPARVELATSSGIDEALIAAPRTDVQRCLYERAVTEGKIWVEKTIDKCEKIAGRQFFADGNTGFVSIPMRYRGKIIGVINLFLARELIDRIDGMKPLLTSIGHHLSVAIERWRSDEETHKHLINDERTRIAHELHDSLAQSLASLRYQVRVLDETLHQGDESTTWQHLERIENSLDEANTELRELISNFRAPVSGRGLIGAIEQIVNQFRNETRIRTYLQKEWAGDNLTKDAGIQVLRIIQEALWNIRKHSQAKTVRIMLRHGYNNKCHILVEDDGIGISSQVYGSPGEHVGLTIMRERAARIGGELRVESDPGEGTRVVLEFVDPTAKGDKTWD